MCDAQEPIKAEPASLTLGAICDRLQQARAGNAPAGAVVVVGALT